MTMPQPSNLIPVYMTEVDWKQVITELDHNIYYLTKNEVKDLAGILSIIKDNIERQTAS
jgi:hypothetical protein